ncbi:Scr1 family TA system antitoxin-like transcriptional regulator [Streptomyces sp. NPDC048669]|uniref:Scr1 family TA system antitoxin-like transcriptional regulator n=1 Tax=Streptomyces sp. NPDC048669 TaxID=3155267 RepID=UPI003420A101
MNGGRGRGGCRAWGQGERDSTHRDRVECGDPRAGLHLGVMAGPFQLLRFPTNRDGSESEPPTVYADGYTGDLYLDKPAEVASYDAAFVDIWNNASDDQASQSLISEVAGSYEQG